MGQFHHYRGLQHLSGLAVTEFRSEQYQHGPESLAASIHEVTGGLSDEGVVALHRLAEFLLDDPKPLGEASLQGRVGEGVPGGHWFSSQWRHPQVWVQARNPPSVGRVTPTCASTIRAVP